jgi:hypothetical protein
LARCRTLFPAIAAAGFRQFRLESTGAPNWSSNVLSDSTGLVDPSPDTFAQHLALKSCDCSKDLKSQPTRWRCGVEVLFQRDEQNSPNLDVSFCVLECVKKSYKRGCQAKNTSPSPNAKIFF